MQRTRSRVQIHGKQKTKALFVGHKHDKAPVLHPKPTKPPAKAAISDLHSMGDAAAVSPKQECAAPAHEDVDKATREEPPMFRKQRVPSTEEITNSGRRRSILRAAMATSHTSSAAASSDDEEWSDSPWASLILEAPAIVLRSEAFRTVENVSTPAAPCEPPSDKLAPTWLQTLVVLFAGRKKPLEIDKGRQHKTTSLVTPPLVTAASLPQAEDIAREESERSATPPSPPLPRLTLRQVIPSVQPPSAEDPACQPGFRDVPTGSKNIYMGNAVLIEDIFQPENVQRGFKIPNSSRSTLSVPPLGHRRNRPDGSLFDRKGDKWMQWHMKYAKPESNPFSRTNSSADLNQLNTNDTSTGSGAASTRSSDSSSGMSPPMFLWRESTAE